MNLETYRMLEASVPANEMKSKNDWLAPLFIAPRALHARSLIILHGRGDNAYSFAKGLLSVRLSKAEVNLAEMFPDTKLIFPTSKPRCAVVLGHRKVTQWFDIYTLKDPDQRQEIQHEGLHDSLMFVHDIIRQEAKIVGLANVVLGGLSQGCALGLHVLMSFGSEEGQHLGGFFGMSGWLPFAKQLEALSEDREAGSVKADGGAVPRGHKDRHENPFGNGTPPRGDSESASGRAAQFVRQQVMGCPTDKIGNYPPAVPIFLGHGKMDEKVSMGLGENAARIMAKLGWKVTWKSYVNLGHWYSREELEDIVSFIQGLSRDHVKE